MTELFTCLTNVLVLYHFTLPTNTNLFYSLIFSQTHKCLPFTRQAVTLLYKTTDTNCFKYAEFILPIIRIEHNSCFLLITNEMDNFYNQFFYSTVFCLLYMFRTNLVFHHQEYGIIYCITQFGTIGTIGTIVQASLDSPARQYRLYQTV